MPKFQYEAMDAQGKEVKDEVEAPNTEEAIQKIRAQGYFPTKVKQKSGQKKSTGGTMPGQRRKTSSIGGVGQKPTARTQYVFSMSALRTTAADTYGSKFPRESPRLTETL